MTKKKYHIETDLSHFAENRDDYHGAVVPPIFQNSLFTFPNWDAIETAFDNPVDHNIYTRGRNPTVFMVEQKIALLAGGEKAKLFASGMAAITAGIMHFVKPGDHIITIKNVYGPTNNLLNGYLRKKMNVDTSFVGGELLSDFENEIRENTTLIYLESPSSAVFSLQDISSICQLAKSKGIKVMLDNSWASPMFQKPLAMGVDLEMHSCSKYLGGHSDIVAGVLIGNTELINAIQQEEYVLLGAKMAPMEAWLLLRSLRTLPMRMETHQKNAYLVAYFLNAHPAIKLLRFPGLESFPQYELGKQQMTGYGGLMSFTLNTDDLDQIKAFVNTLDIFKIGVSWGGHESLVYAPAISYLKELSPKQFKEMGISLGDIRISVGLENPQDLIDDLRNALKRISSIEY